MTDRERFLAVVYNLPLLKSDAIYVLAGEDATPRLSVATELLTGHDAGTPIVLSGGVHAPPRILGADYLRTSLMGKGISPKAITVENKSQNTREQAVALAKMAKKEKWRRVLVVASTYHVPRSALTCIQAFDEAGVSEACQLLPFGAPAAWFKAPAGADVDRLDLFVGELEKVEAYRELGHVASYERGCDYFAFWEANQ